MTIQTCYRLLGGDFSAVEKRLAGAHLIARFLAKFPDDGSFSALCRAMEAGDRAQAFRAAHTLKGVSGNLGFDRLYNSAARLTALLRPETDAISNDARLCFAAVRQDYEQTLCVIRAYLTEPDA